MDEKQLLAEAKEELSELRHDVEQRLEDFHETGNDANRRLIEEATHKVSEIFTDSYEWMKANANKEKITEALTRFRQESVHLLNQTRDKVIAASQNEQFRETLQNGKDFLIGSGKLIVEGVKYGADRVMENEKVAQVVASISEKIDDIREDERFQEGTAKLKEGTMKLADQAYAGIKRLLDKDQKDG